MNKYNNGKIYKLVNTVDDKIYVGSTTQLLTNRFQNHKYVAKKKTNRYIYTHLNSIGWANIRIVLIESVFAENKDQLIMREQQYIDLLKPELNGNSAYTNCPHGREHNNCIQCGGRSICEHNRRKTDCKKCGGGSICEHNRIRSKCKECFPYRHHCYECDISFGEKINLVRHENSEAHKIKYEQMINEVFN
jgi:group I intron endonuclease